MAEKIKYESAIHGGDGKFKLIPRPEIELELDQFARIVSRISEHLQWEHQGIRLGGMDGAGVSFEKRSDGTTLVIEDTVWLGLIAESNSREVLEKIKPILEEALSQLG